jgi:hypothetical protein
MSGPKTPAERRARRASLLFAASGAASVAAALIVGVDWRLRTQPEGEGVLAPGLAQALSRVGRIVVTSRGGVLTLAPGADGKIWRLAERGGYPVHAAQRQAILTALANARTERVVARDPSRFAALGLGDFAAGGTGVRVAISDDRGASLLDVILGAPSPGAVFALRAGEGAALAVKGAPLGLDQVSRWLDLRPARMARDDVFAVLVSPAAGPVYRLERPQTGGFAIAAPYDRRPVVAPVGVSATAHALTAITPIDVAARAQAARGALLGRVVVETRAGVRWAVSLAAAGPGEGDPAWMTIDAAPARADAVPAAQAVQDAFGPWAFLINALDAGALLAPLASLVRL